MALEKLTTQAWSSYFHSGPYRLTHSTDPSHTQCMTNAKRKGGEEKKKKKFTNTVQRFEIYKTWNVVTKIFILPRPLCHWRSCFHLVPGKVWSSCHQMLHCSEMQSHIAIAIQWPAVDKYSWSRNLLIMYCDVRQLEQTWTQSNSHVR